MRRKVMVQPREGAGSGDTALLLETGPGVRAERGEVSASCLTVLRAVLAHHTTTEPRCSGLPNDELVHSRHCEREEATLRRICETLLDQLVSCY